MFAKLWHVLDILLSTDHCVICKKKKKKLSYLCLVLVWCFWKKELTEMR